MRIKSGVFLTAALLLPAATARAQTDAPAPVSIEKESHHSIAFHNDRVQVFHLHLQPNEATDTHRHPSFYAYFSLQPATISNEVRGHSPIISQLDRGEIRTSKGGFNLAERNNSSDPVDIFVVQPVKSAGDGFATPLALPLHDAGIIERYAGPTMRVYSLGMAVTGHVDAHTETYDSLVIALADSHISESVSGSAPEDWNMKAGDTRWIPHGTSHSETNLGSIPAALMVFEFN